MNPAIAQIPSVNSTLSRGLILSLTFSVFCICSHFSHSFILSIYPAVFLFIFLCLFTLCSVPPTYTKYAAVLLIFLFFSFLLSWHPLIPLLLVLLPPLIALLSSPMGCGPKPKRKTDQSLSMLSKATKIKGWIYKQTLTHTYIYTRTG